MIQRNDRVVLLKDVTFAEMESGGETEGVPRSKKGEVSRVLQVLKEKGKVIVEGVNYRKRATRPTESNPRGGFIRKEMPIDISNVALYCSTCNRGVRVRKVREGGNVKRICVRCSSEIPYP